MTDPWRRLLPASALATLLALGACASSPVTRFHSLQAVPAGVSASRYAGPALQVRAVTVPDALDRTELLREVRPGQFEVRDFDHWAAPLGQLARKALSEDLATRLPPGKLVFPGASWPPAGADLKVEILSFEIRGGQATVQLSWSLRPRLPAPGTAASPALAPQGAQLRLQVAAGDGAGDTAQAFSALLGQLADRIATSLETAGTSAL